MMNAQEMSVYSWDDDNVSDSKSCGVPISVWVVAGLIFAAVITILALWAGGVFSKAKPDPQTNPNRRLGGNPQNGPTPNPNPNANPNAPKDPWGPSLSAAWADQGYVAVTDPTVGNRNFIVKKSGVMFNTCKFRPNSTAQHRVSSFKSDLTHASIHDADKRATQRNKNWEILKSPKLQEDLATAHVSVKDFNEMILRQKPLGFASVKQFNQFCTDLSQTIRQSFTAAGFTNTVGFDLVLAGTATAFYSENPQKAAGSHFDRPKAKKSDIDIAILVKDPVLLQQIGGKWPAAAEDYPPGTAFLRAQQYSQTDTREFLKLDAFGKKWGEGGYQGLTSAQKANTILKREVGIVLFKNSAGSPTRNHISQQSIVWSASEGRNLTALSVGSA